MQLVTVLVFGGFACAAIFVVLYRIEQHEKAKKLRVTPKGPLKFGGGSIMDDEDEHSTVFASDKQGHLLTFADDLRKAARSSAKSTVVKKTPVKKVPVKKAPPRITTATKAAQKGPVKGPTKGNSRSITRPDTRRK